jgi:DNA-binding XRE family transcriptional regulator
MKQGSKYWPLFKHLQQSETDEATLSFAEVEALLGAGLPPSARSRRGWWSNRSSGSLQAAAWMEAGYHVDGLDLEQERVTFRKPGIYEIKREGDTILWNSDLIKALRLHAGWSQAQLAEEMGVRQQTVSEWETGVYAPGRAMSKYLALVAERAGFMYGAEQEK